VEIPFFCRESNVLSMTTKTRSKTTAAPAATRRKCVLPLDERKAELEMSTERTRLYGTIRSAGRRRRRRRWRSTSFAKVSFDGNARPRLPAPLVVYPAGIPETRPRCPQRGFLSCDIFPERRATRVASSVPLSGIKKTSFPRGSRGTGSRLELIL